MKIKNIYKLLLFGASLTVIQEVAAVDYVVWWINNTNTAFSINLVDHNCIDSPSDGVLNGGIQPSTQWSFPVKASSSIGCMILGGLWLDVQLKDPQGNLIYEYAINASTDSTSWDDVSLLNNTPANNYSQSNYTGGNTLTITLTNSTNSKKPTVTVNRP